MPLLRYSIYSQGVNLWLAPTADPRDTWESLVKTIACEGRCFVLSANQATKRKDLPEWVTGQAKEAGRGREELTNGASNTTTTTNGSGPGTGTGPTARRRSMSTRTEENHEIAWRSKDKAISEESAIDEAGISSKTHDALASDETAHATQSSSVVDSPEEYVSAGGSCIVSPMGKTLQGPVWNKQDELIYAEVDFDDCDRGHLDFDAVGHYSRPDAFKLSVEGLDLLPPPS